MLASVTFADDAFWQGDISTAWNTASNWYVEEAPGDHGFVPQSSGGFNLRAIIGTDNPNGELNALSGNPPVISATLTPAAKATVGGLYLGLRELDYLLPGTPFKNPAPAAGQLVGALTISAGTLNNVTTPASSTGADGRIVVGANGRGFLTMTGGTLNGQQLVVGGENFTGDALGTSMVDLSGTALLAINNSTLAANGTAALDRRLKITGPDARLTTSGTVTFGSTSSFTAVLTTAANPVGPAMIQSAAAVKMGGALNVEFSGAGATGHALGDKWNLLTATTGVANNFTNLGFGNELTPSGLAAPAPLGSAYYLRTVDGGLGKLVQVSYEGVLVLRVNRDTGELRITNPLGGNIGIDAYQVTSGRGSMLASYAGLGSTTPGAGVWIKGTNNANGLFEIKEPDMTPPYDNTDAYNLTSVPSVSLGTGFSRTGVAANINNFGHHGEDLVFSYTGPFGGIVRGQIVYEGTKFENNLVLRVNPNNGLATLKNDSLETLVFDGFEIASTTGSLNPAGFTAITGGTGTWQTSSQGTSGLSQLNFTGARTLAPGQEVSIGDISSTNFTTDAAKNGLSMNFILALGLEGSGAAVGDYNDDGIVDAADYTVWRNSLGGDAGALANRDPGNAGNVSQDDYLSWKANYGSTGGPAGPEDTFRVGTVFFDTTLGSGGGSLAMAVPEPSTGLLLVAGLGSLLFTRRRKQSHEELSVVKSEQPVLETGQVGVRTMSRRVGLLALVAVGIVTVWSNGLTATAATGGIPIVNFDMELPGPTGSKVIAFDDTGAPIPGIIPGWTFVGPGVSLWSDGIPGDSGTEGGGVQGNAILLNTHDGKVYQTVPGHTIINPALHQQYRVSFNAWEIFSTYVEGSDPDLANGFRLEARLYSGAYPGTTMMTQNVFGGTGVGDSYHEFLIPRDSPVLTGRIGQSLGIEFDVSSIEYSIAEDPLDTIRDIDQSWAHIDNVVFEIVGLIPGDLNGDGVVNLADSSNLLANMQRYTPFEAEGELTGDNIVNLNDFRALKGLIAAAGSGSGGLAGDIPAVPEPSSIALLLGMLGLAAGSLARRRRGASSRALLSAIVAFAASFTLTAESKAELLYYDPFRIGTSPALGEYLADAPLVGQNPVAPYGSKPDLFGVWELPSAAHTTHVLSKSPPGLNYIGAPAEGGSIGTVPDPVDFGIDNRIGRRFKPGEEWTDATVGTYYISWLQNFGTGGEDGLNMGFRAMEFWRDRNGVLGDSNLLGDLGYNAYFSPLGSVQTNPETARIAFQHQIIDGSPVFVEDGATHLFVMKFILSDQPDSDQIFVYMNPTSVIEPDLPNLAITNTNVQLGAIGIGQFGGFSDNMNTVDELRIATTFIDALPELPIPGDADGDGDVDLDDYAIIIANMGKQVSSALEGDVARADGTQGSDGRVTIADFRIWKDNFPYTPPGAGGLSGTSVGVPEPSTLALASLVACLATGLVRRRR